MFIMAHEIWYLALLILVAGAGLVVPAVRRWDRNAPGERVKPKPISKQPKLKPAPLKAKPEPTAPPKVAPPAPAQPAPLEAPPEPVVEDVLAPAEAPAVPVEVAEPE